MQGFLLAGYSLALGQTELQMTSALVCSVRGCLLSLVRNVCFCIFPLYIEGNWVHSGERILPFIFSFLPSFMLNGAGHGGVFFVFFFWGGGGWGCAGVGYICKKKKKMKMYLYALI